MSSGLLVIGVCVYALGLLPLSRSDPTSARSIALLTLAAVVTVFGVAAVFFLLAGTI